MGLMNLENIIICLIWNAVACIVGKESLKYKSSGGPAVVGNR